MHTYNCHGFHPTLPNGRASGIISVDELGFEINIGAFFSKRVPYEGTQIKLGGASDRLVFINHPSLLDWDIYTNDRSILGDPLLREHPLLFAQFKAAKAKQTTNRLISIGVVLAIIVIPLWGIMNMNWFSSKMAERIPTNWEEKLGRSAMAQLQISQTFLSEEDTTPLLAPLTEPLIAAIPDRRYPFHFYIVENATPNAFALPGGFVVIHSGLILKASNAEELLGVLAHELTHVNQRHGLKSVIGGASIYLIVSAVLGDASGLLAMISSAAPALINQSYSRDFEREADKIGFELLQKANIDPSGLASFFQKLIDDEQKRLKAIKDEDTRKVIETTMGFLSTHPATEERIAYLNDLIVPSDENHLDLESEFTALQMRVTQLISSNNDTSNEDILDAN